MGEGLSLTPTSLGAATRCRRSMAEMFHSFNTYLFCTYDVPGIFLDTGHITGNKIKSLFSRHSLSFQTNKEICNISGKWEVKHSKVTECDKAQYNLEGIQGNLTQ